MKSYKHVFHREVIERFPETLSRRYIAVPDR